MEPTTAPVKGIARKMSRLMAAVGAIGKDKRIDAPGAKYNYRGIDDLYNALQPALIDVGVQILPSVVPGTYHREVREVTSKNRDGQERTRLLTMVSFILQVVFVDTEDGSNLLVTAPAEGYDDSDKAAGKAMSYGMKTALFSALSIPTEDPDADRPSTDTVSSKDRAAQAAIASIAQAEGLDELRAIWADLDPAIKNNPRVTEAKDARKALLS